MCSQELREGQSADIHDRSGGGKKHEDVPEKVMLAKEKNSYLRSFEIFHDIKGQNVGS